MAQPDCPICQGSGWKVVERTAAGAKALAAAATARAGSSAGEPKLVWAVPCDCTAGDRTERALARARVPERYRHCDFESYDKDLPYDHRSAEELAAWNRSLAQAKLTVQGFVREFPNNTEHGLLLMGPCGVGKTHLAVAALKEIILRGHNGLFYDYRELLKEIQDSYNPESQATEMSVLEPVLTAELFLLDDLGSSKPSPWALETVGHILNTRYNEKRFTIITTNYVDAESRKLLDSEQKREETLEDRVGRRIRSRLYEMCRTVEVSAPDYRKVIRNAGRIRA
ncbi:MAG TPA: ATP-binding protein [Candidatus Sulfotelmatobacter sp.]|nr:ATP-binding protein [Candidatus Sulfotelmatobacter sp.]